MIFSIFFIELLLYTVSMKSITRHSQNVHQSNLSK
nr:MAG TPA: hypothetical protein [Caudoviricetes sp.]